MLFYEWTLFFCFTISERGGGAKIKKIVLGISCMAPQLHIFDLTDYNKRGKPIVTQQS